MTDALQNMQSGRWREPLAYLHNYIETLICKDSGSELGVQITFTFVPVEGLEYGMYGG